ncbi:hypothetical protein nbrc107697_04320 [Gordonia crocea]|uniref:Uncharacterized protein n=1 Tax=Gordonia crocea TaxID=589162 RepID=A0A7M3SUR9_9ACTN|nr:hypothetical protein nbrc107697_04320 [Gordonia crocea]
MAAAFVAVVLGGIGPAAAAPPSPDPAQPANGQSAPGYRTERTVTPPLSPIQVPPPIVTGGDARSRTVVYRAYPFLADWLHRAIGRQPWEIRGAARISFLNPADGKTVVINPNGHCDFTDGHHVGRGRALAPIVVDAGGFAVRIEPRAHRV